MDNSEKWWKYVKVGHTLQCLNASTGMRAGQGYVPNKVFKVFNIISQLNTNRAFTDSKGLSVWDDWCKPYYQVGDWVSFYSEIENKIITSRINKLGSSYHYLESGNQPFTHLIRYASDEEIKQAKKANLEKEFVLPEKWCIKSNKDIVSIVASYWDKGCNTVCYSQLIKEDSYINYYWASHNLANDCPLFGHNPGSNHCTPSKPEGFTEITFEQFQKYVLKNTIEMDREKLIEEAKKRYPAGTKYISAMSGIDIYIAKGDPYFGNIVNSNSIFDNRACIYYNNKWAEIISTPEVKVLDKFPETGCINLLAAPEFISYFQRLGKILLGTASSKEWTQLCWNETNYWYAVKSSKLVFNPSDLRQFMFTETKPLTVDDLVKGEIYCFDFDNYEGFISKWESYYIYPGNHYFTRTNRYDFSNPNNIRLATQDEKDWLNACIKADKFISKEEALKLKPDIEEVECHICYKINERKSGWNFEEEYYKFNVPLKQQKLSTFTKIEFFN